MVRNMLLFITFLTNQCWASKLSLRIHGGIDAKPGEFPYVVRIEMQQIINITSNNTVMAKHQHVCTGSALSQVWVLSAAHCVKGPRYAHVGPPYNIERLVIRYGHVEDSPWTKDSFSTILQVIMHPIYHYPLRIKILRTLPKNDILLLKTSPMKIKSYMKLSALDYRALYGHEAVFAGYGFANYKNAVGQVKTNTTLDLKKPLQLIEVFINKCRPLDFLVPGFCLSPRCGEIATSCGGDSGGPLIHHSGLIGVLSLGETHHCNYEHIKNLRGYAAGGVVPVSPYIEWIYSYVNAE